MVLHAAQTPVTYVEAQVQQTSKVKKRRARLRWLKEECASNLESGKSCATGLHIQDWRHWGCLLFRIAEPSVNEIEGKSCDLVF